MMKLYFSPGACSLASHIALVESGAAFELDSIDLSKGQQKTPEYLAINPAGSTPALLTGEGVLTEGLVIMGYIAQTHPEAKLADTSSSFRFGKMQAFNGFLASSLHPAIARAIFVQPPLEGEAQADAVEAALSKYRIVEDSLFIGPWVMGETYTVADGYLYVFCRWAKQASLLGRDRFAKLNEHIDRIQQRPAVRRALEVEGLQPV